MKNKIKKINKYYFGVGIFCIISFFIGITFVAKAEQIIIPGDITVAVDKNVAVLGSPSLPTYDSQDYDFNLKKYLHTFKMRTGSFTISYPDAPADITEKGFIYSKTESTNLTTGNALLKESVVSFGDISKFNFDFNTTYYFKGYVVVNGVTQYTDFKSFDKALYYPALKITTLDNPNTSTYDYNNYESSSANSEFDYKKVYLYYGQKFKLNMDLTSLTECSSSTISSLDKEIDSSGIPIFYYGSYANVKGYSGMCKNSLGNREYAGILVVVPPAPTNPNGSCSADGKTGTFSWKAEYDTNDLNSNVKGKLYDTFYTRVAMKDSTGNFIDQKSSSAWKSEYNGTTQSFSTIPGKTYLWWVHSEAPNGAWSPDLNGTFTCPVPSVSPALSNLTAENITATSATIGAQVTNFGVPIATAGGMGYSTSPTGPFIESTAGFTAGNFLTRDISGLTPNTKYYYRAYVINSSGKIVSVVSDFTTQSFTRNIDLTVSPSTVISSSIVAGNQITITSNASNIGTDSINDSFDNLFQLATDITDLNNPMIKESNLVDSISSLASNEKIALYKYNTFTESGTYYARFCVDAVDNKIPENNENNNCSTWSEIVVEPASISISTSPVTSITTTTAVGGGNVISGKAYRSGLVWGLTANPTYLTNIGKTTDGWRETGLWLSTMTGLTPNTTYHFRAYATSSLTGTVRGIAVYGSDVTFTTPKAPSGTLKAGKTSCEIARGASTCKFDTLASRLSYSVSNTTSVSNITSDKPSADSIVVASILASPTSGLQRSGYSSYTAYYGDNNLYLNNNGVSLASLTLKASCSPLDEWNGSICTKITTLSGILTSDKPSCEISLDASTCNVALTWSVLNGIDGANTAVTYGSPAASLFGDQGRKDLGTNIPALISYPSTTFYLYHDGNELKNLTIGASCAIDTTWDSDTGKCGKDIYSSVNGVWDKTDPNGKWTCTGLNTATRYCNNPAPFNGGDLCTLIDGSTGLREDKADSSCTSPVLNCPSGQDPICSGQCIIDNYCPIITTTNCTVMGQSVVEVTDSKITCSDKPGASWKNVIFKEN